MGVFHVKTQSIGENFIEHITVYIIGIVWPRIITDRYGQEPEFSNILLKTADVGGKGLNERWDFRWGQFSNWWPHFHPWNHGVLGSVGDKINAPFSYARSVVDYRHKIREASAEFLYILLDSGTRFYFTCRTAG